MWLTPFLVLLSERLAEKLGIPKMQDWGIALLIS